MAIFSKKPNNDEAEDLVTVDVPAKQNDAPQIVYDAKSTGALVVPRLSEKAGAAARLNKYIFTVFGKMNKLELRKSVEKMYGVKIAQVNMINIKGKARRFGRTMGRTSDYKKAIVTLTPDSKKIDLVEPS